MIKLYEYVKTGEKVRAACIGDACKLFGISRSQAASYVNTLGGGFGEEFVVRCPRCRMVGTVCLPSGITKWRPQEDGPEDTSLRSR